MFSVPPSYASQVPLLSGFKGYIWRNILGIFTMTNYKHITSWLPLHTQSHHSHSSYTQQCYFLFILQQFKNILCLHLFHEWNVFKLFYLKIIGYWRADYRLLFIFQKVWVEVRVGSGWGSGVQYSTEQYSTVKYSAHHSIDKHYLLTTHSLSPTQIITPGGN